MSKKVESGLPITTDCPPALPPSINSTVKKVATAIISRPPTTALSLNLATSLKGPPPKQAFRFKVPLSDNLRPQKPLNISEVQNSMQKGDQAQEISVAIAFYFQAICNIETSQPHMRGLLLKAICYLKSAKLLLKEEKDNKDALRHAQLSLEAILEQLLDPTNKETEHCRFISLLGSACLALYIHTVREAFLNQARFLFGKATKLLEREDSKTVSSLKHENQDPLRYKIALGLALSHFYHVKNIFCSPGTPKTGPILQHLQASRSSLEQALSLQEGDHIRYMLALNHILTGYSIEQEKKGEASWDKMLHLNRKSLEHLNIAIKILDALDKTPEVLTLLGIVKYKLAFGCSNDLNRLSIDLEAGVQAQHYLTDVYDTSSETLPTLLLCLGDCNRQLAWLSQLPYYKRKANRYLEEAALSDDMFAETLFLVFSTQNDLLKLIDDRSKMQDVDEEALTNLSENLFLLKTMLKKNSENTLFTLVKEPLTEQLDLLEQAVHDPTITSKKPDEAKKYAGNALKIGDNLNKMYIPILFQYALRERLRIFDLGLELEQEF